MLYLIVFLVSYFLLTIGSKMKGRVANFYLLIGIAPVILIAGLRDSTIGTDTHMYPTDVFEFCLQSKNFLTAVISYLDVETGYVALAYLSSQISSSFNFFLTLTHAIMIGAMLVAYKKFHINIPLAFVFFYLIFFAASMNTARQFLAMPLCLVSLAVFMQKKYKKAIFCLLIAFLFHKSSLLFVVIWMLYYLCDKHFKMMSKKKVFLLAPISVVLLMSFFIEILEMLVNIGLTEEKYMERYGSDEAYGASFPISLFAINVFNYVMYMFMTKRIQSSSFVIFSKYILLMGMLLCFTGLISTFAVRMNLYFMMTAIVCIVYALQTCKYRYSWIFVSFYLFYWVMVVVVANLSDTYPYHSAILGL